MCHDYEQCKDDVRNEEKPQRNPVHCLHHFIEHWVGLTYLAFSRAAGAACRSCSTWYLRWTRRGSAEPAPGRVGCYAELDCPEATSWFTSLLPRTVCGRSPSRHGAAVRLRTRETPFFERVSKRCSAGRRKRPTAQLDQARTRVAAEPPCHVRIPERECPRSLAKFAAPRSVSRETRCDAWLRSRRTRQLGRGYVEPVCWLPVPSRASRKT